MKFVIAFIVITMFTIGATAEKKQNIKVMNDKNLSSITYSMHHPFHTVYAVSKNVNSIILTDPTKSTIYQVAVSVRVSTFDSQNANRDSHMMEVTEAIKYPSVTFTSTSIKIDRNELTAQVNLTFHGVTKPMVIKCQFIKLNGKLEISGKFAIKMTDFKINPPSFLFIPVDDEIKMAFDIVY